MIRLLDFAPMYFDMSIVPDGETKRALQRVILKREGKSKGSTNDERREKKKKHKKDK